MGLGQSQPSLETVGWRILEVLPNGPCWNHDICVYFEFIVGINGQRLNSSSETFWCKIEEQCNTECVLTLFNYKTRVKRSIVVTPNANWGGDGLLGLVIVKSDFTHADQHCIRVLNVNEGSPAEQASLQPMTDYMLGTPIEAFVSFSKFEETIAEFVDNLLPIYVYNSEKAEIRLVEITPSSVYSKTGVLGCDVGDGYLHHIPSLTDKQTRITFKPMEEFIVSKKKKQMTNIENDANIESFPDPYSTNGYNIIVHPDLETNDNTNELIVLAQTETQEEVQEIKGSNSIVQPTDEHKVEIECV